MAVDAIYTATAHFDHPLASACPRLRLDRGGRALLHRLPDLRAGRGRRAPDAAGNDDRSRRGADRGSRVRLRGHPPPALRAPAPARRGAARGAAPARERVPLRASAAARRERSRRTRGRSGGGALPSAGDPRRVARVSLRAALAYRLAAQLHVLLEGHVPGDAPLEKRTRRSPCRPSRSRPASPREPDVPRELVRLGLSPHPDDRPDPEDFLTFRLPSPKPA